MGFVTGMSLYLNPFIYHDIICRVFTIAYMAPLNFNFWCWHMEQYHGNKFSLVNEFGLLYTLRAIKDWIHGFWGYIVANFGLTLWQVKKLEMFTVVMCSSTHLFSFDVISGHNHKKFSCGRPLSRGILLQSWYKDFLRAKLHNCFYTITLYFNWFNILFVGIVDIFWKHWNWQICHTHQAIKLNFHFTPLAVSYKLFPRWNQRQVDYFRWSNPAVHFGKSPCELLTEKEQLSGHYVAYFEVDGMCYIQGACDFTMCTFKITGSTWIGRTTSGVTDRPLISCLVEGGNDQTERCC